MIVCVTYKRKVKQFEVNTAGTVLGILCNNFNPIRKERQSYSNNICVPASGTVTTLTEIGRAHV